MEDQRSLTPCGGNERDLAFNEHIWNPKWRTAVGGGYVNLDYNGIATQPDQRAHSALGRGLRPQRRSQPVHDRSARLGYA
jgi:hypothetical protein